MDELDKIDIKLLKIIQENSQVSNVDLAESVKLSTAGVHKRLKKLKDEGYLKQSVALLDRARLGLDLLCFLKITFKQNLGTSNYPDLRQAVSSLPEVLECHAMTGTTDALLKVLVKDHQSLKDFLEKLAERQNCIASIETSIVLEEIKATTALPLMSLKD